jgi:hypothetical protein
MAAYAARQTNAAIAAGARWTDAAARADALQQKYDRLDRELCATIILLRSVVRDEQWPNLRT